MRKIHLLIAKANLLLFVLFNLFSCSENSKESGNAMCFCDSTYFNPPKKSDKEFLCYKGVKCFKLVQNGDVVILTEHLLTKPSYAYSTIYTDKGLIIDSLSDCICFNQQGTNMLLKYIGAKADTINVYTSNHNFKILSSRENSFILPFEEYLKDKSQIDIDVFYRRYIEFDGKKDIVITKRHFNFSSFKEIKNNSFDKMLIQVNNCLKNSEKGK